MSVFKGIKSIVGGFFKVLAYLFVTLGLWLPTLYIIVFLVLVGVSPRLSLHGATLAVFCVGLGIAVVGGLAIAMRMHARGKKKASRLPAEAAQPESLRDKKRKKKKDEADGRETQPVGQDSVAANNSAYGYSGYAYPPQYPYPPMPPQNSYRASEPSIPDDRSDLQRKYFSEDSNRYAPPKSPEPTMPEAYGRTASPMREDKPYSESDLGANELWRRLTGAEVPDEQPLVFRTRRDENLYVYEYSDRYQYWRQTKAGMVLEETEYKKPISPRDDDNRKQKSSVGR